MENILVASTIACTVFCLFWVLKYSTSRQQNEADFPRVGPEPGVDDQVFMTDSFRLIEEGYKKVCSRGRQSEARY